MGLKGSISLRDGSSQRVWLLSIEDASRRQSATMPTMRRAAARDGTGRAHTGSEGHRLENCNLQAPVFDSQRSKSLQPRASLVMAKFLRTVERDRHDGFRIRGLQT